MSWQQTGAILGVFLGAIALGAAIVSGFQKWRAHADAEDALCDNSPWINPGASQALRMTTMSTLSPDGCAPAGGRSLPRSGGME